MILMTPTGSDQFPRPPAVRRTREAGGLSWARCSRSDGCPLDDPLDARVPDDLWKQLSHGSGVIDVGVACEPTDKEAVLGEEVVAAGSSPSTSACACGGADFDDAVELLDRAGAAVVPLVLGVVGWGAGPVPARRFRDHDQGPTQ